MGTPSSPLLYNLFIVKRGYTNPSLTRDWPSTLLLCRPSFRALQIFNTAVLRADHARRHLGKQLVQRMPSSDRV